MRRKRREAKHNPFQAACHVHSASFVIGAETTEVINVGIQLQDADYEDLAARGVVQWYLSSDAHGDVLATPPTTLAIGTDGLCVETISNSVGMFISEADGDIDINITLATAYTFYLVLIMPDGRLVVSDAITFDA